MRPCSKYRRSTSRPRSFKQKLLLRWEPGDGNCNDDDGDGDDGGGGGGGGNNDDDPCFARYVCKQNVLQN